MKSALLLSWLSLAAAKFNAYEDLVAWPKFAIKYLDSQEDKGNHTMETLHLGSSTFQCSFPTPHQPSEIQWELSDADLGTYSSIMTSVINNRSYVLFVDEYKHWTFKYSPITSEFLQLHIISPEMDSDLKYTLGSIPSNLTVDLETRSLTTTLSNGTFCELIKKPRSVKLYFGCHSDQEDFQIVDVKEYRSCCYEAHINVPELCQFEFFRQESEVNQIECYAPLSLRQKRRIYISELSDLKKFGSSLFVSSLDSHILFINTRLSTADIGPRLVSSGLHLLQTIGVIPPKSTIQEFINLLIVKNEILNIKAPVFDKFGAYLFNVHITIVKNITNGSKPTSVIVGVEFVEWEDLTVNQHIYFSSYGEDQQALQAEPEEIHGLRDKDLMLEETLVDVGNDKTPDQTKGEPFMQNKPSPDEQQEVEVTEEHGLHDEL